MNEELKIKPRKQSLFQKIAGTFGQNKEEKQERKLSITSPTNVSVKKGVVKDGNVSYQEEIPNEEEVNRLFELCLVDMGFDNNPTLKKVFHQ
jgi:flagellar basal body rod protein FlgF